MSPSTSPESRVYRKMVASVAADFRTYCTWHTEAMRKFGNCLVRRSTRPEDPECTPPRREHGRRTRRRGSCCCCCCSCRSPTRYTPSQPRERVANVQRSKSIHGRSTHRLGVDVGSILSCVNPARQKLAILVHLYVIWNISFGNTTTQKTTFNGPLFRDQLHMTH